MLEAEAEALRHFGKVCSNVGLDIGKTRVEINIDDTEFQNGLDKARRKLMALSKEKTDIEKAIQVAENHCQAYKEERIRLTQSGQSATLPEYQWSAARSILNDLIKIKAEPVNEEIPIVEKTPEVKVNKIEHPIIEYKETPLDSNIINLECSGAIGESK